MSHFGDNREWFEITIAWHKVHLPLTCNYIHFEINQFDHLISFVKHFIEMKENEKFVINLTAEVWSLIGCFSVELYVKIAWQRKRCSWEQNLV